MLQSICYGERTSTISYPFMMDTRTAVQCNVVSFTPKTMALECASNTRFIGFKGRNNHTSLRTLNLVLCWKYVPFTSVRLRWSTFKSTCCVLQQLNIMSRATLCVKHHKHDYFLFACHRTACRNLSLINLAYAFFPVPRGWYKMMTVLQVTMRYFPPGNELRPNCSGGKINSMFTTRYLSKPTTVLTNPALLFRHNTFPYVTVGWWRKLLGFVRRSIPVVEMRSV